MHEWSSLSEKVHPSFSYDFFLLPISNRSPITRKTGTRNSLIQTDVHEKWYEKIMMMRLHILYKNRKREREGEGEVERGGEREICAMSSRTRLTDCERL